MRKVDLIIENEKLRDEIRRFREKEPLKEYEVMLANGEMRYYKSHGFSEYNKQVDFWKYPHDTIAVVFNILSLREL